ncbi:Bcr/CflA family efflux MFS transporter [Seongchinamella unica]|uniref:Bcr/CflA family efflux transporter n=1 Tax=Seongchinamella unica TaxID=2547392 RepID=A0A4R5LWK5_9GAMM|nr:multidrug effflux MFS transporter [Seongchinamella unica]TDG15821.1 Bcr/CflA family efflux MFS transporter [Seongchinamella unica]
MANRYLKPDSPWLLALLAALVALGPLSVDMYLPAMPSMMRALDTDIGHMHLTLSSYLAGFAVFHLACGPLADRFGRKPVLLGGTLVFVVACFGCAQSTSIEELLTFRFLQGIGACVGPTLARTVTRDVFGPRGAARALSLIAMLMALGPAVAPTLGGFVLLVLPWPVIFLFLACYGLLMILLLQVYLAESLPQRQSLHPVNIARNYALLVSDSAYLAVTLASALIYSGLMAYLSSASFVYIDMLGVPVQYFGFVFLTTVAGYIVGSAVSARMASRYDSRQTMLTGAVLCLLTAAIMWLGASLYRDSIWVLMLPMTLYAIGMGLVLPHAMAMALAPFPHIAGTASALLGFIQMGLSALAAALVGTVVRDSPQPMLVAMFVITLGAFLLSLTAFRLTRRSTA